MLPLAVPHDSKHVIPMSSTMIENMLKNNPHMIA